METPPAPDTVLKEDVALLLSVVRDRFLNHEANAIVLAIEGLGWLVGDDTSVTRASLERERIYWDTHSIV